MQTHEHRLHPDWLARLEMFRQFASGVQDSQAEEPADEPPRVSSLDDRWPLPKLTYRHRSTFSHRPR
jgi:hypothetical protein